MKKYNNWKDYYRDNYSTEEYKNYSKQKEEFLFYAMQQDYMNQLADQADQMGNDLADFTNEVVNGLTVKNNQIVFTGKMKETKTYSMKLAEMLGRQLGRELVDLPFKLLNSSTKEKKKK